MIHVGWVTVGLTVHGQSRLRGFWLGWRRGGVGPVLRGVCREQRGSAGHRVVVISGVDVSTWDTRYRSK